MARRSSETSRIGSRYRSPCGIHLTRYLGPCPYCKRVIEDIKSEPLGVSKFKIGPGQNPLMMDRKSINRRKSAARVKGREKNKSKDT